MAPRPLAFALALLSLLLPAIGAGALLAGRTAVICLGDRAVTVTLDAEGRPAEAAGEHDGPCLAGLDIPPLPRPASPHRAARPARPTRMAPRLAPRNPRWSTPQGRAPPA